MCEKTVHASPLSPSFPFSYPLPLSVHLPPSLSFPCLSPPSPLVLPRAPSPPQVARTVELVRSKGGKVTREPGPVKGGKSVIAFVEVSGATHYPITLAGRRMRIHTALLY